MYLGDSTWLHGTATDPDGDNVYLWILWFEGCPGITWDGPYDSGEIIKINYTTKQDRYWQKILINKNRYSTLWTVFATYHENSLKGDHGYYTYYVSTIYVNVVL